MQLQQSPQTTPQNHIENTIELTDITNIEDIKKGNETFDGKKIATLNNEEFKNFINKIDSQNFEEIQKTFTETLKKGNANSAKLFFKLIHNANLVEDPNNLYIGTQRITIKNGKLRIKRNSEKTNKNQKYYDAMHISDEKGNPLYLIIKIGNKIHIGKQKEILKILQNPNS